MKKTALIICSLISALAPLSLAHASTQGATLTMPNNSLGLVGHWTFDGKDMTRNVADTSGQGNTGDLVSFTSTTTVPGAIGQALNFNGTDYMAFTDASQLGLASAASEKTISAWVKTTATDASIVELRSAGGADIIDFSIGNNAVSNIGTGRPTILVRDHANVGLTAVNATVAVNDGKWHHVVVTRNSSQLITLYIDGVSNTSGTDTMSTAVIPDVANSAIGKELVNGAVIPMVGSIDDVRILNRAVSATEVKQLYNQGAGSHQNTTITPPNLANGLVGHWTFDGKDMTKNVADTSGQGNTGDLLNFTSTTTVQGMLGQALRFNSANNQGISTGNFAPPTKGLTVSIWINPSDWHNYGLIMDQWNEAGSLRSWALAQFGNGTLYAYSSGNGTGGDFNTYQTTATVPKNTWTHVTVVYGASSVTIYLNGVAVSANSGGGNAYDGMLTTAQPVYIGYSPQFAVLGNYFNGSLDDARVYNRALSAAEVNQLYNLGTATHQNVTINPPNLNTGLVGHWTFDGKDMIKNVADTSGQGNNGLLTGATTTVAGVNGQALQFNGSTTMVDAGTAGSLTPTSQVTLSGWVKTSAIRGEYLVSKIDPFGAFGGYALAINTVGAGSGTNDGSFACWVGDTGSSWVSASVGAGKISDGRWHLVSCTYDATNVKIYFDGALQTTAARTANLTASSDLTIGRHAFNSTSLSGAIDDVRVYNRALSQSEITQLYNLGH